MPPNTNAHSIARNAHFALTLTVWRHIGIVALLTFCRQPSRQRVVDRVRAGVGTGVVPAAGTTTAGVDRSSVDGGRRGSIRSTTNLAWKRRAAGTLRSDSASGAASRQPTSASSTPARTVRLVAEMVEPAITRRRLGDWKHSTLHSLTRREAANTSRRSVFSQCRTTVTVEPTTARTLRTCC